MDKNLVSFAKRLFFLALAGITISLLILNFREVVLIWEEIFSFDKIFPKTNMDAYLLIHFYLGYLLITLFLLLLIKVIKLKLKPKKEEGFLYWSGCVTVGMTGQVIICLLFLDPASSILLFLVGILLLIFGAFQEFSNPKKLKKISLKELREMANGKKLYWHEGLFVKSKENFLLKLRKEYLLQNMNGAHYILCESKEHYVNNVKIVPGNCAESTPLVKFNQGETYKLLAGDPYQIRGTVGGIFSSGENRYLVIKTSFGEFLLARVGDDEKVEHLQILE
ncbi:MAG: hypothetical protein NUV46_01785 [Nanoarchaeota archaeon]|nr:hypothetical protein [Nanoarchaeota archaeon]